MNPQPGSQERAAEQQVTALMAEVERLLVERRETDAHRLWAQAATIMPDHPLVLHERARQMMRAGQAQAAREILEKVLAVAPRHVMFLLTLAAALRMLGHRDEELAALERALTIEPRHLVALLQKGALLELMNKPRAAAKIYSAALQSLSPRTRLSPPIQAHVEHARKRVLENAANMEVVLDDRLHSLRARADSPSDLLRLDRCVERLLGKTRIYTPEPTSMYFPFLKNYEFHPREDFPWLEALESATEAIREELLAVLSEDRAGMRPYIAYPDGLPLDQWQELNHSRRWSAYFLWNDGQREDAHMARCPRTVEALSATPQVDIAGRGPTAFFSILDAHTHIPPHTGVTNTRLIVHLPLIVPPGCRFRVGGEMREWRSGKAWVFDDTIEHEAWNDADVSRVILIFDVWNPQLTLIERDLVRELTVASAEYGRSEGSVPGVLT
jgi:aspartyl/asparaginyl beta-hydroxylase (cupin superfamily)